MTSKKVSTTRESQKTTRKLTTTTSKSSSVSTTVHPGPCTPLSSTTLLFAYSNDFDQSFVTDVINNYLKNEISPHYTTFASIRFDTKAQGDFGYFTNFRDIALYAQNHPPQPSLGFASNNSGSDVLRMIDRFLDNTRVPVCGSRMIIYAKRYPNETDYSQIVAKMRQHHVYLSILASTFPSGGYHPETLYDIASKTNGMCELDSDVDMEKAVDQTVSNPYLVYAANPIVSGSGRVSLPVLSVLQNQHGNIISNEYTLNSIPYGMQLQYGYSDSKQRKLHIRIYMKQDNLIDYWLPYDN
ncbi:hypothetical protein CAEBREN_09918 [Caenorhabditis brenneri]|uniref:Uncharacterized protein n=1 Tax=Caenorhabditis brenneri TaxID=135651 RepID=G0N2N3_CAEBE|nr:hypothetical protein CAEBREN_09918 [Caenorhabditis brenneri]